MGYWAHKFSYWVTQVLLLGLKPIPKREFKPIKNKYRKEEEKSNLIFSKKIRSKKNVLSCR